MLSTARFFAFAILLLLVAACTRTHRIPLRFDELSAIPQPASQSLRVYVKPLEDRRNVSAEHPNRFGRVTQGLLAQTTGYIEWGGADDLAAVVTEGLKAALETAGHTLTGFDEPYDVVLEGQISRLTLRGRLFELPRAASTIIEGNFHTVVRLRLHDAAGAQLWEDTLESRTRKEDAFFLAFSPSDVDFFLQDTAQAGLTRAFNRAATAFAGDLRSPPFGKRNAPADE
jgi:hypothetical protein